MRAWPVARSIFDAPLGEANERTTGWITIFSLLFVYLEVKIGLINSPENEKFYAYGDCRARIIMSVKTHVRDNIVALTLEPFARGHRVTEKAAKQTRAQRARKHLVR